MEGLVANDQVAPQSDDSAEQSSGDQSDHVSLVENGHSDKRSAIEGTLDISPPACVSEASEAVTVDSPSHHNGEHIKLTPTPVEDVTNDITMATKRTSPSSCSSVAKRQKQRKREQDKMAALKYRHRKKQEIIALDEQQTKLEHENIQLIKQVELAEEQIVMLKSLLRKIYAPCNHSNIISQSSSSDSNSD